jgi:type II secretory pathway component GspD/PulD (secretin)
MGKRVVMRKILIIAGVLILASVLQSAAQDPQGAGPAPVDQTGLPSSGTPVPPSGPDTGQPGTGPAPDLPDEAARPKAILVEGGLPADAFTRDDPPPETAPRKDISGDQALEKVMKDAATERLSLDLKGIDINEFFRILSMKMGVTIVPTKAVTGRVNIYLNNLSLEDALDVVIYSQDLAMERRGDIISVMTGAEYERAYGKKYNEKRRIVSARLKYAKPSVVFAALGQLKSDIGRIIADESTGTFFLIDIPEKVDLMQDTIKELDIPSQNEIFSLQYASPDDVKGHLAGLITAGLGEVYVDERSSKIFVSDLPEKMNKIREMISAFDEPTKEVFIEAEIVQVSLRDEFTRGINWERVFRQANLDGLDLKGSFPLSSSFSPSPDLSGSNIKISIGTLATNNYTAALQLLSSYGETKILSEPRIAAMNNQEAKILVGSREAYITQTLSQGQSTTVTSENIQFTDVGVKLLVTPTINDEGYVTMKIKPEVSSVREVINTALGSRIPIVETSEAETMVKVQDGTMIMIAGLMKEEKREDTSGIPMLGRLPFLGAVFGAKGKQKKKTELIIFITPHIISGDRTVPGTEPAKLIPADITPERFQHRLITEGIEQIKADVLPANLDTGVAATFDPPRNSRVLRPSRRKSILPSQRMIDSSRLKGLKDF